MTWKNEPLENIVEKGENAGYQHFLLFPQCFLRFPKQNFNFSVPLLLSSANALNLDQAKNLSFGKELITREFIVILLNMTAYTMVTNSIKTGSNKTFTPILFIVFFFFFWLQRGGWGKKYSARIPAYFLQKYYSMSIPQELSRLWLSSGLEMWLSLSV